MLTGNVWSRAMGGLEIRILIAITAAGSQTQAADGGFWFVFILLRGVSGVGGIRAFARFSHRLSGIRMVYDGPRADYSDDRRRAVAAVICLPAAIGTGVRKRRVKIVLRDFG